MNEEEGLEMNAARNEKENIFEHNSERVSSVHVARKVQQRQQPKEQHKAIKSTTCRENIDLCAFRYLYNITNITYIYR